MRHAMLACLVFGLATVPPRGQTDETKADKGQIFQDLSFKDALAKAKSSSKVVMVEFTLSTCGNCKAFDERTLPDKNVQQFIKDKTVAIKVSLDKGNITKDLGKFIAGKTVRTPTFLFVGSDGKELGRAEGFMPAKGFLEQVGKFVK